MDIRVQLEIALPTAARAIAGLYTPPAAFLRLRSILQSRTSLKVTASLMGRVMCPAKCIRDASTTALHLVPLMDMAFLACY